VTVRDQIHKATRSEPRLNFQWPGYPSRARNRNTLARVLRYTNLLIIISAVMKDDKERRFKAFGANRSVEVICTRYRAGDVPLCPRCGAELLIAFNWEEANRHSIHPGIECPVDARHFQVLFNVVPKR